MFLNQEKKEVKKEKMAGFRPLPGFCVSQLNVLFSARKQNLFPSPSGVLCFSMLDLIRENEEKILFPSPSGVLCFSIVALQRLQVFADRVSVPFRGSVFLNSSLKE